MKKRHVTSEAPHVAAVRRAIAIADGSQTELARRIAEFMGPKCKISQQTIWYWLNTEVGPEAKWWPAFEHVTNGEVTGADLRPDVFLRSAVLSQHVE